MFASGRRLFQNWAHRRRCGTATAPVRRSYFGLIYGTGIALANCHSILDVPIGIVMENQSEIKFALASKILIHGFFWRLSLVVQLVRFIMAQLESDYNYLRPTFQLGSGNEKLGKTLGTYLDPKYTQFQWDWDTPFDQQIKRIF